MYYYELAGIYKSRTLSRKQLFAVTAKARAQIKEIQLKAATSPRRQHRRFADQSQFNFISPVHHSEDFRFINFVLSAEEFSILRGLWVSLLWILLSIDFRGE